MAAETKAQKWNKYPSDHLGKNYFWKELTAQIRLIFSQRPVRFAEVLDFLSFGFKTRL